MRKQITILLTAVISTASFAQTTKSAKRINTEKSIAIQGYDTVAYFESGKATKGYKELASTYQDAVYCFSTENNKTTFIKNPSENVPQFGGHCAYGI